MVAACLGRESGPESAECGAEVSGVSSNISVGWSTSIGTLLGLASGCRRRRGGREPIPKGILVFDRVRCLQCHGALGVAILQQHGTLWRDRTAGVGERVARHLVLWAGQVRFLLVWTFVV